MKIYKKFSIAIFSLILMSAFSACDKIAEDERYIDAELPELGRKVLVEEFTGQMCLNCPNGHEALSNIKKLFGENVISVSIHAGSLSMNDETYGLWTPDGDKYAAAWGVQAYPCIVVNRQGGVVNNLPQWQDAVISQMGQTADVNFSHEVLLENDSTLLIASSMLSTKDLSARYQVWITENNIKAPQLMPDMTFIANYEHNHVYRASVNGVDGEAINLEAGVYKHFSYFYHVPKGTNVENLNVVAFVYDDSGVLQVDEISLQTINDDNNKQ